jgi:hypothetical protein
LFKVFQICKRVAEKLDMQRFDLRKLSDAEIKEQYQVKITNRFATLENFDDNVDMIEPGKILEKI